MSLISLELLRSLHKHLKKTKDYKCMGDKVIECVAIPPRAEGKKPKKGKKKRRIGCRPFGW